MRLRPLDILRGVAVVLVLFRHAPLPEVEIAPALQWAVFELSEVGWIGVDLFFVLSGFLVSGLLFREYQRYGSPVVGHFWVRRAFKIYPAFYFLLMVTWLMQHGSGFPAPPHAGVLLLNEAAYIQNYRGGLWNHTWSLAVEEHFYLMLPLLLVLAATRGAADPFRRSWIGVPILCGAVLLVRLLTVHPPYNFLRHLFPTHLRIDTLLWGVLLSYAFHFRDRGWLRTLRRWAPLTALAIVALLTPPFVLPVDQSIGLGTWGLTSIALGFTLLLAVTLAPEDDSGRASAGRWIGTAFAAIGVDSYAVYLWHMPVVIWMLPSWRKATASLALPATERYLLDLAVYLMVAIGVGMLLARLIERPMLALRDRIAPSRSGDLPAVRFVPVSRLDETVVAGA